MLLLLIEYTWNQSNKLYKCKCVGRHLCANCRDKAIPSDSHRHTRIDTLIYTRALYKINDKNNEWKKRKRIAETHKVNIR